ncbi:MAG: hypothetical protein A3F84_11340 [Candidatus Handelsmanbacteria bacterium RIFCSPLOWO2_12_FULL_64_10]|uniref:Uncharacterized protein n=1 Tax=Handelsmanbacteria sp. (strain RIFCSPLOWO2_12_FULL_64_10) TaxID=1817868 RepID=A0A1F6CDB6_HANXR|nr:MAG: hypothetical protein A3F84_11340 [Candidatus Handelsmanbacteria bacterium RIFCSPLOWO2_12_FULL_64_10]
MAGVTSAAGCAFPELAVALWESTRNHDYTRAFEQQHQLNELTAALEGYALTTGRTVYRDLLRMRGLSIKRYPRWPSEELEEEGRNRLYEELEGLGAFAGLSTPPPRPMPAPDEEPQVAAAPAGDPEPEAALSEGSEGAEPAEQP